MSGQDHTDHKRTLKRPLSRSRSRSSSQSFNGSDVSKKEYDGKVSVNISIPDNVVGALMGENLKLLEKMRSLCSPVTIWIKARSKRASGWVEMRSMELRGDSLLQIDDARGQIHRFIREKLQITVDGVLPSGSPPNYTTDPNSLSKSNRFDENMLPFPLPTPTPTVSMFSSTPNHSEIQESPEAPGASSLLHENYSPTQNLTSEGTIPIFMEVNEKFTEILQYVQDTIQLKFPETRVSLQKVSDHDNPDQKTGGASHMIFIRASSPLCLVVARAVILHEFKERLGVALEEENPDIKELQEKLERKEELVRKHENEIKNLTGFNRELHKHYKEKSKRHQNDFELVANEKAKLSQSEFRGIFYNNPNP